MLLQQIKDKFLSTSLGNKLILAGNLLSIIAVFMPVYSDFNQWGDGVTYIGITGPLSFIGIAIFCVAVLPILTFIHPISQWSNKKFVNFEKASRIYIFQSILLLILMSSIYLDSEFGINISVKELRAGIIVGFFGVGLAITGFQMSKFDQRDNFELQHQNAEKIIKKEKDLFEIPASQKLENRMHKTIHEITKKGDLKLKPENYNLRMDL